MMIPMSDSLTRVALHATTAAACFSVMGACAKAAAKLGAGDALIVFSRNLVAVLVLGPWLMSKGMQHLKTQRLGGHLWRSAFGILGMYTLFYAISRLSLAEALLLNYSSPLFIPLLAWLVLGERPALILIPAAAIGFVGVALVVKPSIDGMPLAALVGVASGVFAACAMVSLRRISDTEPAERVVFYFAVFGLLVSSVPVLWQPQAPSPWQALLLLGVGLAATAGQLQLTRAYACAPAARVGAMGYSAVVFSGLLGWMFWDERLDHYSLIGALLIISTCVLASWQPTKKRPPITPEDASS